MNYTFNEIKSKVAKIKQRYYRFCTHSHRRHQHWTLITNYQKNL